MSVLKWIDEYFEKNTKKCLIIDAACPVDNNLILKRNEKLDNYSELRLEKAKSVLLGTANILRKVLSITQ